MEIGDQNSFIVVGTVIASPKLRKTAKEHDVTEIRILTERISNSIGRRAQRIIDLGVWGNHTETIARGYRVRIYGELYPGKYGPIVTGTSIEVLSTDLKHYAALAPPATARPWERRAGMR